MDQQIRLEEAGKTLETSPVSRVYSDGKRQIQTMLENGQNPEKHLNLGERASMKETLLWP